MRSLRNSLLLLSNPKSGWQAIANEQAGTSEVLLTHTLPLALIPAACWYFGVTAQGWQVAGQTMRLTAASAAPMCTLFFLAMVAGVLFLAYMVHWMAATYHDDLAGNVAVAVSGGAANGTSVPFSAAVRLVTYTATPFFVAGLLGLYPLLWIDLAIGTAVSTWCVYLLYTGVPVVMQVPPERGFLYASAVFAVALVAFVGLLTATVLLWEFGATPEYTY